MNLKNDFCLYFETEGVHFKNREFDETLYSSNLKIIKTSIYVVINKLENYQNKYLRGNQQIN